MSTCRSDIILRIANYVQRVKDENNIVPEGAGVAGGVNRADVVGAEVLRAWAVGLAVLEVDVVGALVIRVDVVGEDVGAWVEVDVVDARVIRVDVVGEGVGAWVEADVVGARVIRVDVVGEGVGAWVDWETDSRKLDTATCNGDDGKTGHRGYFAPNESVLQYLHPRVTQPRDVQFDGCFVVRI